MIHCLQWYSDNSSAEEKQLFIDEINVMKRVSDDNNPHVLKMLGCVTATNPMMLVLQFVPQGNLKNYLRAMKTEDDVRNVIIIIIIIIIEIIIIEIIIIEIIIIILLLNYIMHMHSICIRK